MNINRTALTALRAAFTLVEVLVVIAIIGILMGILIPVLSKMRERGRIALCESNVRQLCTAWTAYATDHFGEIVPAGGLVRTDAASLSGYLGDSKVKICPSAPEAHYPDPNITYAISDYLNGGWSITPVLTVDRIKKPSQTFVFVEPADRGSVFTLPLDPTGAALQWQSAPCYWHDGMSLGFVDGHVEYFKYQDARTRGIWSLNQSVVVQPDNSDLQRLAAMVKPE